MSHPEAGNRWDSEFHHRLLKNIACNTSMFPMSETTRYIYPSSSASDSRMTACSPGGLLPPSPPKYCPAVMKKLLLKIRDHMNKPANCRMVAIKFSDSEYFQTPASDGLFGNRKRLRKKTISYAILISPIFDGGLIVISKV